MNSPIDTFLASYSREAREITLCLRTLIFKVFPETVEQIDPKSGIIAYGFDKTCDDFVFAIAPHMKNVNLLFSRGATLSDPVKMLVGTGKEARHVKIKSEAETENPALRLLLEEAIKLKYKEHS